MPQLCKICSHPNRDAIDAALIENERAMRDIGAEFDVTKDSLSRHWINHIPESDDGDDQADEDPDEPGSATETLTKPNILGAEEEAGPSATETVTNRNFAERDEFLRTKKDEPRQTDSTPKKEPVTETRHEKKVLDPWAGSYRREEPPRPQVNNDFNWFIGVKADE